MHGYRLNGRAPGATTTYEFIDEMLEELNTDYIDLVLMHFPGVEGRGQPVHSKIEVESDVERSYAVRKEIWRALESEVAGGRVRNIGVSNFLVPHLEELSHFSSVLPAVNQLELHPYLPRADTVKWCKEHGVVVTAYGSLVQDVHRDLIEEPLVVEIGKRLSATPAQVALAWALEQDIVVVPKSSKAHRMVENAKALDIKLSKTDMGRLNALDCSTNTKCRYPTRCGEGCTRGAYYWDPARVPTHPEAEEKEKIIHPPSDEL
eukprot:TRINITY_DN4643_c0_g1_i3.p1 TRINITY_DN4643_c0_g1~~TRINITY_DN4643_c0_g1_i3.p1  ORF type:complete len:262 (-),score=36.61 TRINITY_DN4643_c0_g1_i3:125-910(-)